MKDELKSFVAEKSRELIEADSCCPEAKEAAKAWLAAVGTPDEEAETERYLTELAEDIEPIEGLIAFAGSEAAVGYFGKQGAADLLAHAEQLKASGAKYCDCAACSVVAAILDKTGRLA